MAIESESGGTNAGKSDEVAAAQVARAAGSRTAASARDAIRAMSIGAICALALGASGAMAQQAGTILHINNGNTVFAAVAEPVRLVVAGKGACAMMGVATGDAVMASFHTNVKFPQYTIEHRYAKPGTYLAKVHAGSKDCDGQAEVKVVVR